MTPDRASDIAISGLQYIAGDSEQLSRFVSLSGVSPDEMRTIAHTREFIVAILDYFMGDEPTLLSFAASMDIDPADIARAKLVFEPENHPDL